ncbi:methyl-accepting chemotaxis protein [Lederbergia lenta]|uniref:Methyl-accepting chemotaxis sensory transducer n=1 Tax=Lederbergia lenta TaxID=1467 RepID=A0A2X4W645_LEDLE|nr:methyl-accepting chemotaxis protein [Lederbergia lenta]MEC2325400.1 methyl-accepting chemotaxis protein [Lederbergia lenta]SQI55458.1 methyl-accepting chemotaxis sensory transducer [Lederbergia lenta]
MRSRINFRNVFLRPSIGKRLLVNLLLFSMIPIIFIGFFSYEVSSSLIRDKVSDVTQELITQVARNYEQKVAEMERITLNIATSKNVSDGLDTFGSEEGSYEYILQKNTLDQYLGHQSVTSNDIKSLIIVSEKEIYGEKNEFSINTESPEMKEMLDQIHTAKGTVVWLSIPNEESETGHAVFLGREVANSKGVLLAEIDNSVFNESIQEIKLGETGYLSILNNNWEVIVNSVEKGENESSLLVKEIQKLNFKETDTITFFSKHNELVTTKKMENTDWTLFSSVPIKELTTETSEIAKVTIIVGAITFLLSLVVALIIARRMTKPIKKVTEMMKEVEIGNLQIASQLENSTYRQDEIGQLTDSLKNMVEGIRKMIIDTSNTAEIMSSSSLRLSENAVYNRNLSDQTNESIQHVAHLSFETVASTEESAVAFESIAIDIQKIAEASSKVSSNSVLMSAEAEKGQGYISNAVTEIEKVNKTVGESVQLIEELDVRSNQVAQITGIISSIADQTNLLALNASIEAARAGEHGQGFTVVADEVRKLAQQSQNATKDIGALISEIQSSTKSTVLKVTKGKEEVIKSNQAMEEAGLQFRTIMTSIQGISEQIKEVTAIIHEISANSEEVSATVHVMNENTSHSNQMATKIQKDVAKQLESIDQASIDSKELEHISQKLLKAIQVFKV